MEQAPKQTAESTAAETLRCPVRCDGIQRHAKARDRAATCLVGGIAYRAAADIFVVPIDTGRSLCSWVRAGRKGPNAASASTPRTSTRCVGSRGPTAPHAADAVGRSRAVLNMAKCRCTGSLVVCKRMGRHRIGMSCRGVGVAGGGIGVRHLRAPEDGGQYRYGDSLIDDSGSGSVCDRDQSEWYVSTHCWGATKSRAKDAHRTRSHCRSHL